MAAVLEELEYIAWHFAAEPTEARLADLLKAIEARAPEIAGRGHAGSSSCACASETSENASEALAATGTTYYVGVTEDFQESSRGHPDVPQGNAGEVETIGTSGYADAVILHERAKRCTTCKAEKPAQEFSKDKARKDGRRGRCRECESEQRRRARALRAVSASR